MSQDMDTDDGAQTHSRRALLKLSGAAATGLVASSSVGAADSAEFDWEAYEAAVAERYSPGEAAAAVAIIRRHTDGERRLTEAELTVINEQIVQHPDTPAYTADIKAYRANASHSPSVESTALGTLFEGLSETFALLPGNRETYGWDGRTVNESKSMSGVAYADADASPGQHDTLAASELMGTARVRAEISSYPIDEPPGEYLAKIDWSIEGYIEGSGETYLEVCEELWDGDEQVDSSRWYTFAGYTSPDRHRQESTLTTTITVPAEYDRRLGIRMRSTARGTNPCFRGYPPEPCVGNQAVFREDVPEAIRDQTGREANGFNFSGITITQN